MAPTEKSSFSQRCVLAHDLLNDLNVILGRCELLGELAVENAEAARHLRILQEAANHMLTRVAERPCQLVSGKAGTAHSFSRHEDLASAVD